MKKIPYNVSRVAQETHDIWSVCFEGEALDYSPGQFMIIEFVREGEVLEPHPFTISSSPTRGQLCISVKSVGDFTATIRHTKTGDLVYIRAPYGIFSFLNHDAEDLARSLEGVL